MIYQEPNRAIKLYNSRPVISFYTVLGCR